MKDFWVPVLLRVYGADELHATRNVTEDLAKVLNDPDNSIAGYKLLEIEEA